MRVLISSAGTRGDVQPVVALATELRSRGHETRLCVPPNFRGWVIESGFEAATMGVEMRAPRPGEVSPALSVPDLITDQFDVLAAAAEGCDLVLGANAHQYAAHSIAELHGLPYINAVYAPVSLPSPDHAPPGAPDVWQPGKHSDNVARWDTNRALWNARALERINANRRRFDLKPINDVLTHVLTDRPLLAADSTLGPGPATPGMHVTQTGAWILADRSPLAPDVAGFLDAGEPPIYVGFGSMPVAPDAARVWVDAARAVGRRVILSRGWARITLHEDANCLEIGDVNQQRLFPRVATVVHHGGAGTTFAAAAAEVPQVIVPMFTDQPYWASRVRDLGIGASYNGAGTDAPTLDVAAAVLESTFEAATVVNVRTVAEQLTFDGAAVAARALLAAYEASAAA
jgi:vancomycin aglycone glucosyltransferase